MILGRGPEPSEIKARTAGTVRHEGLRVIRNERGESIAPGRGKGRIQIIGLGGRPMETYSVPHGAWLLASDGALVRSGQVVCRWDPHTTPILSEAAGTVRLRDVVEGQTLHTYREAFSGVERRLIRQHRGERHPHVLIEDASGQPVAACFLPEKALLLVYEGMSISPGRVLAQLPREFGETRGHGWACQSGTGTLPRLLELLSAQPPREAAKMAEVSGGVRMGERVRGKRTIYIRPAEENRKTAAEVEHVVPPGKHVRVATNDQVKAGDRLVFGPLDPHDILRISGVEAAQNYLVDEVRQVFRSQRVEIDDKHIEIIVARMIHPASVAVDGIPPAASDPVA